MTAIRQPRSVKQATELLERFAVLDGRIGEIEAKRNAAIATINAEADGRSQPLLEERDAIQAKLAAWWPGAAEGLTEGKRKSIELGGCMIGSREGRPSLGLVGKKEAEAVEKLKGLAWADGLLRTKVSLDRVAVLKALDGANAKDLRRIGFRVLPAEETFFVNRVAQGGTLGGA